jgi:hypothetical protein
MSATAAPSRAEVSHVPVVTSLDTIARLARTRAWRWHQAATQIKDWCRSANLDRLATQDGNALTYELPPRLGASKEAGAAWVVASPGRWADSLGGVVWTDLRIPALLPVPRRG